MRTPARSSSLGLALALGAVLLTSCGQGGSASGVSDDTTPSRTTQLSSSPSPADADAASGSADATAEGSQPSEADRGADPDAQAQGCPDSDVSLARPSALPADFPLPGGMRITDVEDRSEGRLVLQGVTTRDFTDVLHELQQALPKAGYQPSEGEVEPRDAESNFASSTTKGRWAIREVAGCGTLVSLVTAAK